MQRPGAHADELRGEGIAAVGADDPARFCLVPIEAHDLGVEQRVVVQAVLLADALAVREDFRRMRVLLRRHVAGFFEQRHVDHRRRIALRARIPVPVPGAAEVAALLDDADIPDAGFGQPRGGGEPGKAAADEGEGDVVGLRLARGDRRIGVVEIMRELPRDPEILVVAVGAQPLVALLQIFLAQPLLVDRGVLRGLGLVGHRHPGAFREWRRCPSLSLFPSSAQPSLRAKRSNPPIHAGIDGLLRRFAPRNDGGETTSSPCWHPS